MNELTQQGIAALKSGDRASARKFLTSAVRQDPNDSLAWLWLTGALDTDDERLSCLRQVLRIDPGNQAAARGMAQILERRTRSATYQQDQAEPGRPAATVQPEAVPHPPQPEPVPTPTTQTRLETEPLQAQPPAPKVEAAPVTVLSSEVAPAVEVTTEIEAPQPAPQPVRRRVPRPVAETSERPIFRERPSLVPALLCFWLFLFGSILVSNLLNGAPDDLNLPLAGGLGLILEVVVVYVIIRNMAVRYELTSQQFTLRYNGKRARIPITEIYNAELSQTFLQRIIGIGHIDIDAAVNGQLAHIRVRNIPRAKTRTDQILYLVRDNASS
jgi:hypothetical protein